MDEREQIEVDIAQLQTLIEEDDDDECDEHEESNINFQQYPNSHQFTLSEQTSEWTQSPHTSSQTSQSKVGSNQTSTGQQSIVQYEDDRSELLSERSSMFTSDGNLETCLALNLAYQEITQEMIDELVLLLENNRTKQRILQDEMKDSMKKGQQSAEGRTFRDRSSVLFFAPYFKDSTGKCAPPNEDTLIKKANKEMTAYLHPSRPWSKEDRKQLLSVVTENARELAMEQVMTRKDILSEKILQGNLNQVKSDEIEEKLKETEEEIKRIKKMSIHDLLSRVGNRLDWMKISTTNLEGLRTPEACELMWTNVVHPAIRKDKWTKAEDQRLQMIAAKWGERNWDEIAKDLHSNRTAFQCMERYQSKQNPQLQKGVWTKGEDSLLFEVVMSCKVGDFIPWPQVAYYVEDRSTQQCKYRWTNALDPMIKRGKWSKEEDTMLLAAVARHGENWMKISKYFPGRNNYQCRERYCNTLRPDIKLSNWTVPEDMLILKSVKKYGEGNWAKIARNIPGRTDNAVLQRYKSLKTHLPEETLQAFTTLGDDEMEDEDLTDKETIIAALSKVPNHFNKSSNRNRELVYSALKERVNSILKKSNKNKQVVFRRAQNQEALQAIGVRGAFQDGNNEVGNSLLIAQADTLLNQGKRILDHKMNVSSRGRNKKTKKEKMIDGELFQFFKLTLACNNQIKKGIARTMREEEEVMAVRNQLFQLLKIPKPSDSDEDEICVGEHQEIKDKVNQVFEESVKGKWQPSDDYNTPVFPPNQTTVNSFKLLLAHRNRLLLALKNFVPSDVLIAITNRGHISAVRCQECVKIVQTNRFAQSVKETNHPIEQLSQPATDVTGTPHFVLTVPQKIEGSTNNQSSQGVKRLHEVSNMREVSSAKRFCGRDCNSQLPGISSNESNDLSLISCEEPRHYETSGAITEETGMLDTQTAPQVSETEVTSGDRTETLPGLHASVVSEKELQVTTCNPVHPQTETSSISCNECLRVQHFFKEYQLLKARFLSLFLWPAFMSQIKPMRPSETKQNVDQNGSGQETEETANEQRDKSKKKRRTPMLKKRKLKKPWVSERIKQLHREVTQQQSGNESVGNTMQETPGNSQEGCIPPVVQGSEKTIKKRQPRSKKDKSVKLEPTRRSARQQKKYA